MCGNSPFTTRILIVVGLVMNAFCNAFNSVLCLFSHCFKFIYTFYVIVLLSFVFSCHAVREGISERGRSKTQEVGGTFIEEDGLGLMAGAE